MDEKIEAGQKVYRPMTFSGCQCGAREDRSRATKDQLDEPAIRSLSMVASRQSPLPSHLANFIVVCRSKLLLSGERNVHRQAEPRQIADRFHPCRADQVVPVNP
jgi:hypothetical protein